MQTEPASDIDPEPLIPEAHEVLFGRNTTLSILQVQPSVANYDSVDYAARRQVFRSVMSWLGSTDIPAPPSETASPAHKPEPPRLTFFPELYVPVAELLGLLGDVPLQGTQIVCAGIVPDEGTSEHGVFFDSASIRRIVDTTEPAAIGNIDFLGQLERRLAEHGRCANLAATLTCDVRGRRSIIFHAKVIPSKYERRQHYEANTIAADRLFSIHLIWQRPPGAKFVLLPLICSDFATTHPDRQRPLLGILADSMPPVNMISVLSVQRCNPAGRPPWPREYQTATLDVAEQRIGPSINAAHTVVTNVGRYTAFAQERRGGFSFLTLQNGPDWRAYVAAPLWDGVTWYFGRRSQTLGEPRPGHEWVLSGDDDSNSAAEWDEQLAALHTHAPPDDVEASLQHFEINPVAAGERAWESGRLLYLRNGQITEGTV